MGRFHKHEDGTDHEHDDGHGDMSGYRTGPARVIVLERIFHENDRLAAANRSKLDAAGVTAVNMMSSPGAGKTAILRACRTPPGSRSSRVTSRRASMPSGLPASEHRSPS